MDNADYGNSNDLIDDPDMAEDVDLDGDVEDRSDLFALKQGIELADMSGVDKEAPARTSADRCPVAANVNLTSMPRATSQNEPGQCQPKAASAA
eukprot:6317628-Heterocapsa_arctica.AAC.1